MEKYLYNSGIKKIEYYLKRYNLLDLKISRLSEFADDCNYYRHGYTKWLRNKCSSLEEDAIRNIELEQRIYRLRKWQSFINAVLNYYKAKDRLKYKFICLKYFKKLTPYKIQERMNLTEDEQEDLKVKILNYMLSVAIKKNMLKEVEV